MAVTQLAYSWQEQGDACQNIFGKASEEILIALAELGIGDEPNAQVLTDVKNSSASSSA